MNEFTEYLAKIDNPQNRVRMEQVLDWVSMKFPDLEKRVAWNQPMFTHHGTFIIGFSISKKHMALTPESAGIIHFHDKIIQAGYDHTEGLIRILWDKQIDFSLIEEMITFNILEKAKSTTFWRK